MKIEEYPDKGKYVINDLNEESLIYRINTYEDLFLLKSIKDSNPNLKEITIPCMFQQQHDKRFNSNESFELKIVCDFINSCKFKKVKIFHPHSDVTPALINNCEVISNEELIRNVFHCLLEEPKYDYDSETLENNLVLMSSDAGGFKPLIKLCKQLDWKGETYSASKSRERDKLIQVINKQDFQGRDILIIDDICVYGGTFIGLANLLKEKNIGKLYLAVSHITIGNPNTELYSLFDRIFTTNSKGLEYKTNLKVIKLF